MNPFLRIIITGIFFYTSASAAAFGSDLEKELLNDIQNNRLEKFTHLDAALILSGWTSPDSLAYGREWYGRLIEKINAIPMDFSDRIGSAKKVFLYLHSTLLKQYQLEATTLLDIIRDGTYNCVSATILFNLVCEDMRWPVQAFETPGHVYTIFNSFGQHIIVENTTSMGFDILSNLEAYTNHLAQFSPNDERLKIGLHRFWAWENSRGRQIGNTELLGLLAYNRAYFLREDQRFKEAYDKVLLAQQFNHDSRYNRQFEKRLVFDWGSQLMQSGQYNEAFQVLADAAYRYPDERFFSQNCKAAFDRAGMIDWRNKNWRAYAGRMWELIELNVITRAERDAYIHRLGQWEHFLKNLGGAEDLSELIELIHVLSEIK